MKLKNFLISLLMLLVISSNSYSQNKETFPYVVGICYVDLNANGQMDAGEPPLKNIFVQPGICHAPLITCVNGYYYAHLCSTEDTLRVIKPDWAVHYTVSPSYHHVWQDSGYVNFGFIPDAVPDIQIKGMSAGPVARQGKESGLHVTYRNIADTVSGSVLTITLDNNVDFISASPAPDLISANVISWNIDTINPLETGLVHVNFSIPFTVSPGTILNYSAVITSASGDVNISDNSMSLSDVVTDTVNTLVKEVFPSGNINYSEVQLSPVMTYNIRFRNTDTVTIANIRITDTISPFFSLNSFELLGSSHVCQYQLDPSGLVTFTLSDIMLPDSSENEAGSFGHISYSIRLRNTLMVNDTVLNRADIFYDFNEAVSTNTTVTVIDDPTIIGFNAEPDIQVFPNPAEHIVYLSKPGEYIYCVTDITGKLISSGTTSGIIDISDVSPGLYILDFTEKDDSTYKLSVKLIVF